MDRWIYLTQVMSGYGAFNFYHILDLFLFHLEVLGNMLVNQSRVKGNENVLIVSPHYQRYCDYILIQFLNIDYGLKFSEKYRRMKLS